MEKKIPKVMADLFDSLKEQWKDEPELLELFKNCYTNTLDTTVKRMEDGTTHVITGDIPAMWLRDSAAQLRPYIFLAKEDREIREIIAGLVKRQFRYICIDPYANAFNASPSGACWEKDDPDQNPWVWERKFEVDSLCYPIQMAWLLWKNTGCVSQFEGDFQKGIGKILEVFRREQAHEENSDYRFIRGNSFYNDTLSREGKGALVRSNTGLIWSGFRPSDDACTYGYLIPSKYVRRGSAGISGRNRKGDLSLPGTGERGRRTEGRDLPCHRKDRENRYRGIRSDLCLRDRRIWNV